MEVLYSFDDASAEVGPVTVGCARILYWIVVEGGIKTQPWQCRQIYKRTSRRWIIKGCKSLHSAS
jgi:hypothetical protein